MGMELGIAGTCGMLWGYEVDRVWVWCWYDVCMKLDDAGAWEL